MKEERINKVLEKMKEIGLTQMIITDPVSIAYLAVITKIRLSVSGRFIFGRTETTSLWQTVCLL